MEEKQWEEYEIRNVAGYAWLIHVTQSGNPYEPPVPLNATGAEIVRGRMEGKSISEIGVSMAETYGGSPQDMEQDVKEFLEQL